jgi:hypothetical protein
MFRKHTVTPAEAAIMAADAPTTTIPPIHAPHGAATVTGPRHARKPRRVFMWFFLVIQVIFVAWVIGGIASHTGATTADVNAGCLHGAWQGLFKSQADCLVHYRAGLDQAAAAGTAIGVGLVIGLWVAVDAILGITRLVVLTARRHRRAEATPAAPARTPDMMA